MLIYVAGKYSGDVDTNIRKAREVAIRLWEAGHHVICPHLNTAHMEVDCSIGYDDYIRGDLDMLSRCDAIYMLEGWQESKGAQIEWDFATENNIPIYYDPAPVSMYYAEIRCPEQSAAFRATVMDMYRLHLTKNADYSPANILGTGEVGLVTRMWDKVARLMNLTGFKLTVTDSKFETPTTPKHESILDTVHDLAVYSVIYLLHAAGKWGK